ncbi:LTA synthase family protein [Priestia koreensis]|uniref:LTA synthase family protein n=1 Tax=Priestia koreensis TaxID=284581 RepID=UPI002040396C|nr:LTA synthase family protein [Priestia koreensis]MCM3002472.1 LTA synthase family protein [Priestia koreensis]
MRLKKDVRKFSFLGFAALLLWIKTYIVYKTCFDIDIENWHQELILFINPLSFLLILFGFSLFFKSQRAHHRYIIIASFLASFVLAANVIFYRFFNDFLTLPVLFQMSNMGDLGGSVAELLNVSDFLLFSDVLLLWAVSRWKRKETTRAFHVPLKLKAAFYTCVLVVFSTNLVLSEVERPELLTRTFDREILVKNLGTYNYHVYDAVLQSKSKAQRALADSSELVEIQNYMQGNREEKKDSLFGVAKGKNVIVISMESTQSFVINQKVNGQEITPFLNQFIKESYYFNQFYHQTGQGKTSDAEFLVDNSLYPLGRGSVFFTHAGNKYYATPTILKRHGYYSAVLHANNKSFWNRDMMYPQFGYDRFFSLSDYDVTPENSVGWGLKDIPFFDQSTEYLRYMPQPFYAKFITLTNHFPFQLGVEDQYIAPYTSESKTLNRYFPTVRYTDEALKHFITKLKQDGLYDNSIIIIYGDHYGISDNHQVAMGQYMGEKVTPFLSTQLQRVPFIIHIPGDRYKGTITNVAGQIDIKPTILHLLGISEEKDVRFGHNLFSLPANNVTVLRNGSFITNDYLYTDTKCYDQHTKKEVSKSFCKPYMNQAKKELEYSDKIIYGDLLRFYN